MSDDLRQECWRAPRHAPDHRGVCRVCGAAVPEPWFMRRHPDPVKQMAKIAWRNSVALPQHVADQIVAAVLGYADSAYMVREIVVRQAWEQVDYRDRIRQRMRSQLLDEVTAQARLPVALPSEALRYLAHPITFPGDEGREIPADAVSAGADYEHVEVTLAVPVRTPPVDRKAAVRAGVL